MKSFVMKIATWFATKGYGFGWHQNQKFFVHVTTIQPQPEHGSDLTGQDIVVLETVSETRGLKVTKATTVAAWQKQQDDVRQQQEREQKWERQNTARTQLKERFESLLKPIADAEFPSHAGQREKGKKQVVVEGQSFTLVLGSPLLSSPNSWTMDAFSLDTEPKVEYSYTLSFLAEVEGENISVAEFSFKYEIRGWQNFELDFSGFDNSLDRAEGTAKVRLKEKFLGTQFSKLWLSVPVVAGEPFAKVEERVFRGQSATTIQQQVSFSTPVGGREDTIWLWPNSDRSTTNSVSGTNYADLLFSAEEQTTLLAKATELLGEPKAEFRARMSSYTVSYGGYDPDKDSPGNKYNSNTETVWCSAIGINFGRNLFSDRYDERFISSSDDAKPWTSEIIRQKISERLVDAALNLCRHNELAKTPALTVLVNEWVATVVSTMPSFENREGLDLVAVSDAHGKRLYGVLDETPYGALFIGTTAGNTALYFVLPREIAISLRVPHEEIQEYYRERLGSEVYWFKGRLRHEALLTTETFSEQRLEFVHPYKPNGTRFKAQVKIEAGRAVATAVLTADVVRDVTRYTLTGPVTEPVVVGARNAEHTFSVDLPAGFQGELDGEFEIEVRDQRRARPVYMVIIAGASEEDDDYTQTENHIIGVDEGRSGSHTQYWVISPKGKLIEPNRTESRGNNRKKRGNMRYHWDNAPAGCLVLTRSHSNYGYTHSVTFGVRSKPVGLSEAQRAFAANLAAEAKGWMYFVGPNVHWDLSKVGGVTFTTEREFGRDDLADFLRTIVEGPINPFDYELEREVVKPDIESGYLGGVVYTIRPGKAFLQSIPKPEAIEQAATEPVEEVTFTVTDSKKAWYQCPKCNRQEQLQGSDRDAFKNGEVVKVTCKSEQCQGKTVGTVQK